MFWLTTGSPTISPAGIPLIYNRSKMIVEYPTGVGIFDALVTKAGVDDLLLLNLIQVEEMVIGTSRAVGVEKKWV